LDAEKKALLSLTLVPRIGSSNIKHLISYAGSASAVHNLSLSRLLKIPGIGHKGANSIKNGSLMEKANEIFQQAESESCHVLSYLDKAYPYRLKQIADAPPIIFSKGQWPLSSERPTLAIIGSRNATDNGRRLTNEIIDALSPLKPIILSGLAYGIDITAHKAALRNKLSTYAVLG
jgi:DNA processing protein